MSLKVTFPAGSNAETVRGLYQWDYGQILEIESTDLGSEIVEVHFACSNMNEAIVRSCTFTNGVGSVTIPDACLEQSTPITAWIYQISGTQGHTSKTITLPITARTRPSVARDIPTEVSDRYTELITEVNEAVEALENGSVTVAKATDATNANYAASAGNAATANYATSAGSTNTANALNLNCMEYLNSSISGASVQLERGRIYVITISERSSSAYFDTMVLFSSGPSETETTWISTKSAYDYFCWYDYSSKRLTFSYGDASDTFVPSSVYIREL